MCTKNSCINHYRHLTLLPTSSSLTFWEQIQWVHLDLYVHYPAPSLFPLLPLLFPSSLFPSLFVRDKDVSTITTDPFSYIFPSLSHLLLLFIVPLLCILTYHLFYLVINTEKRRKHLHHYTHRLVVVLVCYSNLGCCPCLEAVSPYLCYYSLQQRGDRSLNPC